MYQIDTTSKAACQIENLEKIYLDTFGYITDGYFVDVGAFDGVGWSNTRALALAGWSGLLVEPHPEYFQKLLELYGEIEGIRLANYCVGKYNGMCKLYLGGSNSTIVPEMIELYNDVEWSKFSGLNENDFIWRRIFTLNKLLEEFWIEPEFEVLSIDVEGAELDVLNRFAFSYWQPQLVIVETHEKNEDERLAEKSKPIGELLDSHNYTKIQADTINTIWRR